MTEKKFKEVAQYLTENGFSAEMRFSDGVPVAIYAKVIGAIDHEWETPKHSDGVAYTPEHAKKK